MILAMARGPRHLLEAGADRQVARVAQAMLRTSATTFWILPTRHDRLAQVGTVSVCKSIQPRSNAICARNASLVRTICGHICGHIPTRGHSSAQSAGKPSHDSMIENDTKACIPAKRSLCVEAHFKLDRSGVVADDSRVPMLWDVISDPRPVECVLSHFLMRKRQSGRRRSWKNNKQHKSRKALLHLSL